MKLKYSHKFYKILDKFFERFFFGYVVWKSNYMNIDNAMPWYMSDIREYTHIRKGQDGAEEYLKAIQDEYFNEIISHSMLSRKTLAEIFDIVAKKEWDNFKDFNPYPEDLDIAKKVFE